MGGGDGEVMCGVIGRLSVLLLDGFKEEQQTNPTAAGERESASHNWMHAICSWVMIGWDSSAYSLVIGTFMVIWVFMVMAASEGCSPILRLIPCKHFV